MNVDDILVTCDNLQQVQLVKSKLAAAFKMKDIGPIKRFLNIDINYKKEYGYMVISQHRAIRNLLEKYGMMNCSGVTTPLNNFKELFAERATFLETNFHYRNLIGSLMFIMLGSRPDIAFAVTLPSRFLEEPRETHWKAAKRILRYLCGTQDYGLVFRSNRIGTLSIFCDADWANSIDRKSVSGIAGFHDGNLIHWKSKKQTSITLSSTEAELVALCEGLKEGVWIQKVLHDLQIQSTLNLHSDNQSCIHIAHNQGHPNRTKHIDIKYLYVQEKLREKDVSIYYCKSEENPSDILT